MSIKQESHEQGTVGLGFWLYLMTDLMLFSTLFATFMVLRHGTAGGPSAVDIFDLRIVLIETVTLLLSSLLCGLAWLAFRYKKRSDFALYFATTLLAGMAFLGIELMEFGKVLGDGHSWQTSAFLTSYFALVGTHGLHILIGLIWGGILAFAVYRRGMTPSLLRKFGLFSLYWHFLDIVWIFIFTVVYIIGGTS